MGEIQSFLLIFAFIAVRLEWKSINPGWGPRHLITDILHRYTRVAFDNKFIVNATDDEAVTEGLHRHCFQGKHSARVLPPDDAQIDRYLPP
jgi:hypothetical protein